jgi:hypothetical protein
VSSFVYDHLKREYYATIKMFFVVNTTANYSQPRRSVGVARTSDPAHWPQPTPSLVADEIDDRWASSATARRQGNRTELYGLSAFAYQTQYIGLLWVAHFGPGGPNDPRGPTDVTDGTIEVEVVSSRDGQQWRRAEPGPDGERTKLIPRGPRPWDGMMIHTSTHPLLVDGKLHLYFQGDSCSHHGGVCLKPKTPTGIGLATLRRDGWAYLAHNSTATPGYVYTREVSGVGSGASLRVNYRASGGGSLKLALYDAKSGAAIAGRTAEDCVPLTGDSTNQTVSWRKDPTGGTRGNVNVQIMFVLQGDVEFYSYGLV